MGRKFLGIQTVISGKTRFFRTVYGAILGFMRLERLSVTWSRQKNNEIAPANSQAQRWPNFQARKRSAPKHESHCTLTPLIFCDWQRRIDVTAGWRHQDVTFHVHAHQGCDIHQDDCHAHIFDIHDFGGKFIQTNQPHHD